MKIAKNYLTEKELQRLNLFVSQFLDFAEFQALEERPMRMADWIDALNNQIIALQRKLLEEKGSVSHQKAIEKTERKFNIYRQREMAQLESDFDKMVKRLPKGRQNPLQKEWDSFIWTLLWYSIFLAMNLLNVKPKTPALTRRIYKI